METYAAAAGALGVHVEHCAESLARIEALLSEYIEKAPDPDDAEMQRRVMSIARDEAVEGLRMIPMLGEDTTRPLLLKVYEGARERIDRTRVIAMEYARDLAGEER